MHITSCIAKNLLISPFFEQIKRILSGGNNYPWGNFRVGIIRGQLSERQFSSGVIILGGICPGGQLSGRQLSRGQFSSGAIVLQPNSIDA